MCGALVLSHSNSVFGVFDNLTALSFPLKGWTWGGYVGLWCCIRQTQGSGVVSIKLRALELYRANSGLWC
jgi:hypothetical protein